ERMGLNANRVRVLFGLNPLILFSLLACTHNDVYLLFCSLVAIKCALDEQGKAAMVILALATALKFVPVLLVPFFILYFVRKKSWPQKLIHGTALFGVFALVLLAGLYLYEESFANIFRVLGGGVKVFRNSVYHFLALFFPGDWDKTKRTMNILYVV